LKDEKREEKTDLKEGIENKRRENREEKTCRGRESSGSKRC